MADQGRYEQFKIEEDEEFLGFSGVLDATSIRSLGVIKWKPPKVW